MITDYLVPSFYFDFKCSMCANCCKGWSVYSDDKSYPYLQTSDDFKRNISENRRILFNNHRCSFLSENSGKELCQIHAEMGEKALPFTCEMYPRRLFFDEVSMSFVLSFSASCPTVLEIIRSCEKISYLKVTDRDLVSVGTPFTTISSEYIYTKSGAKHYNNFEIDLLTIIQNRENILSKRVEDFIIYLENRVNKLIEVKSVNIDINQLFNISDISKKLELDLKLVYKIDISISDIKFSTINLDNCEFELNNNAVIFENYIALFVFSKEFYFEKIELALKKIIIQICLIISLKRALKFLSITDAIFLIERTFCHNKKFSKEFIHLIE